MDAAYSVVQLQKVVQDDCGGASADFEQLKAAWLACRDKLDAVGWVVCGGAGVHEGAQPLLLLLLLLLLLPPPPP